MNTAGGLLHPPRHPNPGCTLSIHQKVTPLASNRQGRIGLLLLWPEPDAYGPYAGNRAERAYRALDDAHATLASNHAPFSRRRLRGFIVAVDRRHRGR